MIYPECPEKENECNWNIHHCLQEGEGADKYKATIKRADDLFKMKRWAEAKTAYEEALGYKKDDPYAISKLEIVNKNLAPK